MDTKFLVVYLLAILCLIVLIGCNSGINLPGDNLSTAKSSAVVLGYSELGMHCMNQDFSEFMILPPYNNLRAQVIDRSGEDPRIITSGITIKYAIPGNTHSTDKTNFWTHAKSLTGLDLAANIGLSGSGLSGILSQNTGDNDWLVTGIPITPIMDNGTLNSYALADITVESNGQQIASTKTVVPVSWEISCDLCHNDVAAPKDILKAHDNLHGTNLQAQKPVKCGTCHQQPPLGALGAGQPGISTLSRAMHNAHASRMADVLSQLDNVSCYACHPGQKTKCLRDVHFSKGMTCTTCHDSMQAVASPTRKPWIDEPRCEDCHKQRQPTFQFEEPGKLFRESKGHNGIHCAACHGSPHAITPTVVSADNVQAIALQGHAGTINTCTVCHANTPDENFNHTLSGGD